NCEGEERVDVAGHSPQKLVLHFRPLLLRLANSGSRLDKVDRLAARPGPRARAAADQLPWYSARLHAATCGRSQLPPGAHCRRRRRSWSLLTSAGHGTSIAAVRLHCIDGETNYRNRQAKTAHRIG